MYRVIDKTFEILKFMSEDKTFLGIHLENEPNLSLGRDLSDYGGNPHTVAAFRKFLEGEYTTVSNLNIIAGTQYSSFEDINPADTNWLMRAKAARFRAKLVTGEYLARSAGSARRHFPDAILVTRLRGCDALISNDNGLTWNLDRRIILDEYEFYDGKKWFNGECGHLYSLLLDDGRIITAHANYLTKGMSLIRWTC